MSPCSVSGCGSTFLRMKRSASEAKHLRAPPSATAESSWRRRALRHSTLDGRLSSDGSTLVHNLIKIEGVLESTQSTLDSGGYIPRDDRHGGVERVLVDDARVVPDEGEHAREAAGLEHRSGLPRANELQNLKGCNKWYIFKEFTYLVVD